MQKNNSAKEIFEKIKNSKNILMSLHEGPDGDSLASSTALKYFLERDLNKKVELISKDEISEDFMIFPFSKEVKFGVDFYDVNLDEFDLILLTDFASLSYYDEKRKDLLNDKKIINFDHHATNTSFGSLNYVDSSRPSACSVLIDLFKKWKVEFDKELSTRLLLGLYTDTLGFSTEKSALIDAAFLVSHNADYIQIVNGIKFNVPLKLKKYFALGTMNFNVKEIEGYKVGFSCISKKEIDNLNLNLSEVRGLPNYLQEIGGIDFLFTLTETEDFIKGSFRSRKRVDTSLFAKELNGGGHKFAAAFRLPKMSLKKAEEKVFEVIKNLGIHIVSG